jgi:hypothetical protein
VAAFVVALAGALLVYRDSDPVKDAGHTPGYHEASHSAVASGPQSAPASSPRGSSSSSSAAKIRTVFLGDDYTAGVGASASDKSWTHLVAQSLALTPTIVGEPGAGYALPSPQHRNYLALVDAAVAAHPDVVVVSGGRNDTHDDMSTLRDDAAQLFQRLHRRLPGATIIALAPWWGDSAHPKALDEIAAAVRSGVQGVGGTYVDPGDPLTGHPGWMRTAADPNDKGYRAIANTVGPAISQALPHT